MNNRRELILQWAEQGVIDADQVQSALALVDSEPQARDWYTFISKLLLWLGVLSVSFGVIFFFAYNWDDLHRWHKFALVEGVLVVATVWAWLSGKHMTRTIAVTMMSLLTGAGLALFGQTYQTGADPWQLFAVWALLVTPLALISVSAVVWLLWLLLVHVALFLWMQYAHWFWGFIMGEATTLWIMLGLNALLSVLFEFLSGREKPVYLWRIPISMRHRVLPQVTVLLALTAVAWLAFFAIFESSDSNTGFFIYILCVAAVVYLYQYWKRDLLLLAGAVFSAIFVIMSLFIRAVGDALSEGALLLSGMILIGLSTAAGFWLRRVLSRWQQEEVNHV